MAISELLGRLVSSLSEENYEKTVFDYRFWMKIGATHGWIPDDQLHNDVWGNMRPELVYPSPSTFHLIHPTTHLLLKFIADVEPNPDSPTRAQLCHSSLRGFFADNSDFYFRTQFQQDDWRRYYTNVNLLAHSVNEGYLNLEDVRDHILQSLTLQPIPSFCQLQSLIVLLKIAGATFAAYVDPPVMDRCLHLLKAGNLTVPVVAKLKLAQVSPFLRDKIGNKHRENRML